MFSRSIVGIAGRGFLRRPVQSVGRKVFSTYGSSSAATLRALLKEENRDDQWVEKFESAVLSTGFYVPLSDTTGPDGFSYIDFVLPEEGEDDSTLNTIDSLKKQIIENDGYGVVIKTKDGKVHWVFSYGDIVHLVLNNTFSPAEQVVDLTSDRDVLDKGTEIVVSNPPESYLPSSVREAMRNFLKAHQINSPRIALLKRTVQGQSIQELAFVGNNYTPEVRERIAWFLPRHYYIVILPEVDSDFPSLPL